MIAADTLRTWLFVAGADAAAHAAALASGADVVVPDLEDFTPPERREQARLMIPALLEQCRQTGARAAVRINPLAGDGSADLAAVMTGRPDLVLLPKTIDPHQVAALDRAIGAEEARLGWTLGSTAIVPNIETAAGLVRTLEIARASPRVVACLVAAEDMAADLGAERHPDAAELAHVRQRFLVECRAAGVEAIDCPYTFADVEGARRDTLYARRLGYRAKSLVRPEHVAAINVALTPDAEEVARAQRLIAAFEAARARGEDRVLLEGAWVEVPTYLNAQRLLARAERLSARRLRSVTP
ncbi:MAG: CoA ester lyase [Alphaproteobacteria bacterium]|nr:CoA ester lyase [Alphaproteobacteria bacterium]